MSFDEFKPGDRGERHEDKRPDRTSERLSKDPPEASAKAYRVALAANPDKVHTLSPDGKSRFSLTDDSGKLDEIKAANQQGLLLGEGGKFQASAENDLKEARPSTARWKCRQRRDQWKL